VLLHESAEKDKFLVLAPKKAPRWSWAQMEAGLDHADTRTHLKTSISQSSWSHRILTRGLQSISLVTFIILTPLPFAPHSWIVRSLKPFLPRSIICWVLRRELGVFPPIIELALSFNCIRIWRSTRICSSCWVVSGGVLGVGRFGVILHWHFI
jgi:hypothetical protein